MFEVMCCFDSANVCFTFCGLSLSVHFIFHIADPKLNCTLQNRTLCCQYLEGALILRGEKFPMQQSDVKGILTCSAPQGNLALKPKMVGDP